MFIQDSLCNLPLLCIWLPHIVVQIDFFNSNLIKVRGTYTSACVISYKHHIERVVFLTSFLTNGEFHLEVTWLCLLIHDNSGITVLLEHLKALHGIND
jgi:hypothetical protein